jgi:hypothetical protein
MNSGLKRAEEILTQRRSAAEPQPKQFHKETRKTGILSAGPWFSGLLIKKLRGM